MQLYSNVFILQLNLLAAIVLLTIALGIILRKNNARPNVFLGILMLYPAVSILVNIIFIIFAQHRLLFLAPINIGFNLTFGPVLLAYLHYIQGKRGPAPGINWVHFIPAVSVFLAFIYYIAIPEQKQVVLLGSVLAGESIFINLINLFLLVHIGVYLSVAWRQVSVYAKGASDLEIPLTQNAVKWQRSLLRIIIAINVLLLLGYAVPLLIMGKAHIYSDLIVVPVAALCLYSFMLYKGLAYHVIYNKPAYTAFADAAEPLNDFIAEFQRHEQRQVQPPVYRDDYIADVKNRLQQLLVEEKVFKKNGLKLHDVAEMLEVSPAMLSFVINAHMGKTFFELVNNYRVAEAKDLLVNTQNSHYKIEYIGELAGFNSRASFFSVFKKQVGKTPLLYREDNKPK